jgi:hypothetical protein
MSVLTNALGLLLALALGAGQHGIEAIVVAFTYSSNATRIMFEFNQIYRHPPIWPRIMPPGCDGSRRADRGDLYAGPHLSAGNLTLAHMRVTGR